jgi:hypothetical protein
MPKAHLTLSAKKISTITDACVLSFGTVRQKFGYSLNLSAVDVVDKVMRLSGCT